MSVPGNKLITKVMMFAEGFRMQDLGKTHCGVVLAVEAAALYAATLRVRTPFAETSLVSRCRTTSAITMALARLFEHMDHDTRKLFDSVLTASAHKVIKEPTDTQN